MKQQQCKMIFFAYCLLLVTYIGSLWIVPPAKTFVYVELAPAVEVGCLQGQLHDAKVKIERLMEEIEARNYWAHGLEEIIFKLEIELESTRGKDQ